MGFRSGFKKSGIYSAHSRLAILAIPLTFLCGSAGASIPSTNAKFAVGPDSNYTLLIQSLTAAQTRIWANIYEFDQTPIAALMIDKIRQGLEVRVLIETQPCCNNKMTDEAKKIIRSLHAEMQKAGTNPNSRIFLMGEKINPGPAATPVPLPGGGANPPAVTPVPSPIPTALTRRYRYNHAKYIAIDDTHVLISSENLTEKGHPLPGTVGNRGYTADFTDAKFVGDVKATFTEDTDASKNTDVLEVGPGDILPLWMGEMSDVLQNEPIHWEILKRSYTETESDPAKKRRNKAVAGADGYAASIEYFYSPKSLPGLEKFIDTAKKTLRIEFMSMPSTWSAGRGTTIVNPIVARAIQAASKGVRVKVLLNDERTFDTNPNPTTAKGNELTVAYLDKMATCYRLPITSKIIDVNAVGISYIHNKGMIADHDHVLISSINGTKNSVVGNRETAVSVESTDLGAYYTKVHDYDWTRTTQAFSDGRTQLARAKFPDCPTMPLVQESGSTDPIFRAVGNAAGFGIIKFF